MPYRHPCQPALSGARRQFPDPESLDLGPKTLAGLVPGFAAVEPDITRQAVVELGELASRTAELDAGQQSLDTDHDSPGQQREDAAKGEGGGFRAGEFPHAGQGRHDLAPFEATGAELPG